MADFERAARLVLGVETGDAEGGWADSPIDRGGRTRYGISSRWFPGVNLDTLTPEGALILYREAFWVPIQGSRLVDQALAEALLDMAVNAGPGDAARALQRAAGGLTVDGVIGARTIHRANTAPDPERLRLRFALERLAHHLADVDAHPAQVPNLPSWVRRTLTRALDGLHRSRGSEEP